jgi:hypothetical protein
MDTNTEQLIQTLRNDLHKNGKIGVDSEDVVKVARANAAIARQLRNLRGHGDLFTTTTTTPNPNK